MRVGSGFFSGSCSKKQAQATAHLAAVSRNLGGVQVLGEVDQDVAAAAVQAPAGRADWVQHQRAHLAGGAGGHAHARGRVPARGVGAHGAGHAGPCVTTQLQTGANADCWVGRGSRGRVGRVPHACPREGYSRVLLGGSMRSLHARLGVKAQQRSAKPVVHLQGAAFAVKY